MLRVYGIDMPNKTLWDSPFNGEIFSSSGVARRIPFEPHTSGANP